MRYAETDSDVDRSSAPPTLEDRTWLEQALESSSDAAYVLDTSTEVIWVNTVGAALVGMTREQLLGRSLAEFVHPDDVVRATEVLGLAASGVFDELPMTAALYRVRDAAGEWISLGVNSSLPQPDGSVLILARAGGDLVLADRLLEAVTANAPFDQQVELVLDLALWRHPLEGYAIIYDEIDGTRRAITSLGLDPFLSGETPTDGATPWASVTRSGRELVVSDLASIETGSDAIDPALAACAVQHNFVGCLAAPVADPTRDSDACIVIWTTERGPTHAGHRYALDNMRRALALVLQQRAQRYLLEQAARVDALTGLLTRAGFFELIEDHTTELCASRFAVLYIDLDDFKKVNDSCGHIVGDQVLAAAAQRVLRLAPTGSIAARLGGDEFVVVCPYASLSNSSAEPLAQQVVDALGAPIETPTRSVTIGASVGLATGRATDTFQQVLESADHALLAAKAGGRARWAVG